MTAVSVAAAREQHPEPDAPGPDVAAIYREHGAHVWRALLRMGVPLRHLEDACHDVFCVVVLRLPTYEPRDRLSAWLTAIAARIAARYRHRERREPVASESEASMPQQDHAPDSENAIADRDLVLRLLDAIKQPERRVIFIMHYLDGETIPEIARVLKIREGTAAKRLRLARAAFEAAARRLQAHDQPHLGEVIPIFGALPLLEAERARAIPPLPDGVADRVWARLQQTPEWRQAHGSGGGGGPTGGSSGTVHELIRHGLATGPFVGILALGIALGALWDPLHASPRKTIEARAEAVATVPRAAAPPAPSSALVNLSAPSGPSAPSSSAALPRPATRSPAASSTTEERTLIDDARSVLASGHPGTAISMLQEFHGSGLYAEEREALWIEALIGAARLDEARERLTRFAHQYPTSRRLKAFRQAVAAAP
jgi:RNA polymerase sigma-70 factor (ECF subfamily)